MRNYIIVSAVFVVLLSFVHFNEIETRRFVDRDPWGHPLGPPPPPKGGKERFDEIQGVVSLGTFQEWRPWGK